MNTADTRTLTRWLKIIGIALVVIAGIFFGAKQCNAQFSGGTFQLSQPYQAIHDEIMTSKYGEDWEADMQAELKEHLRNRLSEAREEFRKAATDAVALPDESLELLTPAERNAVNNATSILREAAKRIKARRDSIAAAKAKTQGYLDANDTRWIRTEDADGVVAYSPEHLVLYDRGKALPLRDHNLIHILR